MKKKDYRYIIAILVLIIIAVITFFYGTDKDQIVSYVSFAGTLVSIVLAIAAIIYAYYQNSVYGGATTKLNESATKIDEATTNLQRVGHFAENVEVSMREVATSLEELASTLPDKIENLQQSLGIYNDNLYSLHQETRDEMMSIVVNNTSGNNIHLADDDEDVIRNVINALTTFQFLFISYVLMNRDRNTKGNIYKYCEWALSEDLTPWTDSWKKDKPNAVRDTSFGMALGILHILLFRNYLVLGGTVEAFEVLQLNDYVHKAFITRIEEQDFKNHIDSLELFLMLQ